MKKTLREELMDFYPAVYFMHDDRTKENYSAYIKRVDRAETRIKAHIREKGGEK